jgi:phage tail sheath protein FI
MGWAAFEGASPDVAYFVRCDRTTMTQDDIDNGRLVFLVGFAPVRPAEFIVLRID